MKSFKDSKDRLWEIEINVGVHRRIKDLAKVDLFDLGSGDPPLLTRLQTDISMLVDCIYCACKLQTDAKNVSDVEFGESLNGEAIFSARTAFLEELVDFFQKLHRPDQAKAVEKATIAMNKGLELAGAQIGKLDPEKMVFEASKKAFGALPA